MPLQGKRLVEYSKMDLVDLVSLSNVVTTACYHMEMICVNFTSQWNHFWPDDDNCLFHLVVAVEQLSLVSLCPRHTTHPQL